MIHYALQCGNGHEFEGWFRDSADFDKQAKRGVVTCPACGSTKAEKQLMAPAVSSPKKKQGGAPEPETLRVAAADPRRAEMIEVLRELRKSVTSNADYVGKQFSEEARKIHYKESEPRGIYGEASPEEAKELAEEGIEFHPLPTLPEDRN